MAEKTLYAPLRPAAGAPRADAMDDALPKRRWPVGPVSAGSVAVAVLAVLTWTAWSDRGARLRVDGSRVAVSTVLEGEFQERVPVTGSIVPLRSVYLDAVEGGRVEAVYVDEGAVVKAGDQLLKLGNPNLQLSLMNQEGQLYEQINNLRNTRLSLQQNSLTLRSRLSDVDFEVQRLRRLRDVNRGLVENGVISRLEFEQVRDQLAHAEEQRRIVADQVRQDGALHQAQLVQLEASVNRLQRNLEVMRRSVEDLVLRAPIDGRLTSLVAAVGANKAAGERLGQIDALDGFLVRVPVDEFYLPRIVVGQEGVAEVGGGRYPLAVTKTYPEVKDGQFQVDMQFRAGGPELRRGQSLPIQLALGSPTTAVLLPRGGLPRSLDHVYVLDRSGGRAVRRAVRIGRQNPQFYEVLDGLTAGDRVISSSYEPYGNADELVLNPPGR